MVVATRGDRKSATTLHDVAVVPKISEKVRTEA